MNIPLFVSIALNVLLLMTAVHLATKLAATEEQATLMHGIVAAFMATFAKVAETEPKVGAEKGKA